MDGPTEKDGALDLTGQLPAVVSHTGEHGLGPLAEPTAAAGKQHVTICEGPVEEDVITVLPREPLKAGELFAYALPAFSTTSLSLLISLYANDFYGARNTSARLHWHSAPVREAVIFASLACALCKHTWDRECSARASCVIAWFCRHMCCLVACTGFCLPNRRDAAVQ